MSAPARVGSVGQVPHSVHNDPAWRVRRVTFRMRLVEIRSHYGTYVVHVIISSQRSVLLSRGGREIEKISRAFRVKAKFISFLFEHPTKFSTSSLRVNVRSRNDRGIAQHHLVSLWSRSRSAARDFSRLCGISTLLLTRLADEFCAVLLDTLSRRSGGGGKGGEVFANLVKARFGDAVRCEQPYCERVVRCTLRGSLSVSVG